MGAERWSRMESRIRFLYEEGISEISNRDWRAPLRTWLEFTERFTLPRRSSIINRVMLNSHVYQTNYALIFVAFQLFYVLKHPWSIFLVAALTALWVHATSPRPIIIIRGRRISRQQRFYAAFGLTVILCIASGVLLPFLRVTCTAAAVILLHAALRHTSMRNRAGEIRTYMGNQW